MRIKQFIFLWILGITFQLFAGFPVYIDLDIGETVTPEGFPSVRLIDKQVTVLDKSIQRIGSSDVTLDVDDQTVVVPVGLEHPDVIVGETRIGVEVISDYVTRIERFNKRFRLFKDARIRLSKATEPLMPAGSHAYPLDTPWNSGFRNQGWLANCYLIDVLQGDKPKSTDRYHDGWDFGVWEGQLVRSVCTGEVVNPDDYPDLIENGLVYNKNNAPVGPNPFLVKDPELPILYYYTHLSGLARRFEIGETIQKGEPLGYASARGSSGGWYHLHFSMIHLENEFHINPFPFISEWYPETLPHYLDFLNEFTVYYQPDGLSSPKSFNTFEKTVLLGHVKPTQRFVNTLPGVVHVRETIAKVPFANLNHVLFDQFVVLKTDFVAPDSIQGELWFGHTGKARLYLNGRKIYSGENRKKYHCREQPFQWDSIMILEPFQKGKNVLHIAIEQTDPFWSFSIRPRDRLGMPIPK